MKWSPVYHVSTIFGNHGTASVLWGKVTFLSACQQTKWRQDRTKFDGEIVSQTRVPPVSTPMNNTFSIPGVKWCSLLAIYMKSTFQLVSLCFHVKYMYNTMPQSLDPSSQSWSWPLLMLAA